MFTALALPAAPDLALLPVRWQRRIDVVQQPGHWMWTGQLNNKGYPVTHYKGQKRPAYVAVWETLVGPVPDGLELDHLCRIVPCVFPLCLEPVTHAENQRRMGEAQMACRKSGHRYTPANTYRDPTTGRRRCRECARELDRNRVPRRRAA
jgi:hypothetical protein